MRKKPSTPDPPRQHELVLGESSSKAIRPSRARAPAAQREQRALQDALITEGVLAVKLAAKSLNVDEFSKALINGLTQNSLETRRRYSQSLSRWFLHDGIDGFLPRVWRAYEDDAILLDLLRYSYLAHEPILAACVAECLLPLENGIAIPSTYFDTFLARKLGSAPPRDTKKRLKINLKRLGFLSRAKGQPDRLVPINPTGTSFLLLLHHLFAAKELRTVEVRALLANPFWIYLGFKDPSVIRQLLRQADAAGVVAKYVVADQLDQVTTCFSEDEILEQKVRI